MNTVPSRGPNSGTPAFDVTVALAAAERRWFEIGAKVASVGGADVCVTPGYEPHPAAAGALMSDVEGFPGLKWLRVLERNFSISGYSTVRLHAAPDQAELAARLRLLGYRSIRRIGYRVPTTAAGAVPEVVLEPVEALSDWDQVDDVHEQAVRPDSGGSVTDEQRRYGRLSVALARYRGEAAPDEVVTYLIRRNADVVGSVMTVAVEGLFSVRNLVVITSARRTGVATGTLARLVELGGSQSRSVAGLVQAETPAFSLCGSVAAEPIAEVIEHFRELDD